MMPRARTAAVAVGTALALALAYVLVVGVLDQDYNVKNLTLTGSMAISTLGLSMLLGWTHQVSLGQSFFFGLGAYVYAILAGRHDWAPLTATVAAILASATVAFVTGRVLLRLDGFHFSVATLGLGFIGENVLFVLRDLTGGDDGMAAPEMRIGGFAFDTPLRQYTLVAGCLTVAMTLAWNYGRSARGRAARAVGLDPHVAASNGIAVAATRTEVFVIGSAYAGLGGVLYAAASSYIFPQIAGVPATLDMVVAVIVGGAGGLVGPVLAIGLLRWLPIVFEAIEEHIDLVYGVALVALLVLLPADGATRRLGHRIRRTRQPSPEPTAPTREPEPAR